jgi:hypothetical protein
MLLPWFRNELNLKRMVHHRTDNRRSQGGRSRAPHQPGTASGGVTINDVMTHAFRSAA